MMNSARCEAKKGSLVNHNQLEIESLSFWLCLKCGKMGKHYQLSLFVSIHARPLNQSMLKIAFSFVGGNEQLLINRTKSDQSTL